MRDVVSQPTRSKRSRMESAFYSMSDVAGICGMGYTTVWTQVQDGTFPVMPVKLGRQWRFPKREINWLAKMDTANDSDASEAQGPEAA